MFQKKFPIWLLANGAESFRDSAYRDGRLMTMLPVWLRWIQPPLLTFTSLYFMPISTTAEIYCKQIYHYSLRFFYQLHKFEDVNFSPYCNFNVMTVYLSLILCIYLLSTGRLNFFIGYSAVFDYSFLWSDLSLI